MTKYLLAILLAALVAVGLWGKTASNRAVAAQTQADQYQRSYEDEKRAREALVESAKRAEAALVARAKKAEAKAITYKKDNRALQEALDANRGWADEPVPAGVLDALRSSSLLHQGVPASGPAPPVP